MDRKIISLFLAALLFFPSLGTGTYASESIESPTIETIEPSDASEREASVGDAEVLTSENNHQITEDASAEEREGEKNTPEAEIETDTEETSVDLPEMEPALKSNETVPDSEVPTDNKAPAQVEISAKEVSEEAESAVDFSDGEFSNANVSHTWGGDLMGLTEAKEKTESLIAEGKLDGSVTVAVIDTGINSSHEWFSGRISGSSKSFIGGGASYEDDNGHGSHVAGIIASNTPSNVKLLVIKALDANKQGSSDAVSDAIRYAANQGAEIINLSLGVSRSSFDSEDLYSDYVTQISSAISYAKNNGCIIVASAGNEGSGIEEIGSFPAGSPNVITVNAISQSKSRYEFSNTGAALDFCAPGEDIYSAWIGSGVSYQMLSGTSMAAPFVSASLAMIMLYNPNGDVLSFAQECCEDLGAEGKDASFGHGLPVFLNGNVPNERKDKPSLSASSDGNSITLTVSVAKNATYRIYKRAKGEEAYSLLTTTNEIEYVDKDVILDTVYEYYVEADNIDDYYDSNISDVVTQGTYYSVWIDIPKKRILLNVGEVKQIGATVNPPEANEQRILYSSSDPEIVAVNSIGELTAKSVGTSKIILKSGNYTEEIEAIAVEEKQKCGETAYWYLQEEDSTLIIYGSGAMYDLPYNEWPWYSNPQDKITKVIIEDGITELGENAFWSIEATDGIEGMKDVTLIHQYAFSGFTCDTFDIPDHAQIEKFAFESAHIKTMNISKNDQEQDPSVFLNSYIDYFSVDDENLYYSSEEGVLFNKDKTALIRYPTGNDIEYSMPNTVEKLYPGAFMNCLIPAVKLSDNLKEISDYTFARCDYLSSIIIPEGITRIGYCAFENCDALSELVLPDGLAEIGAYAFSYPNLLQEVEIPSTVKTIGTGAFTGTPLETITIPEGAYIGDYAFSTCTDLASVHIEGNSLQEIGVGAFRGCDSLRDIFFKGFTSDFKNIIRQGRNEALDEAALHIEVEGSVDSLSWRAEGLSGDLTLTISGNGPIPDFASPEEVPWFDGIDEIKHVVIEDGVTHVGRYAFYGMENLEDVRLPSSVTDYGYSVFRKDSKLELFHHDNGDPAEQLHISVQYLMALYSGQEFKPEVKVEKGPVEDSSSWTELTQGTDFSVEYNNTRNIGEGTITIRFMGDYANADTVVIPFIVASELLKGENIKAISSIELKPNSAPYTGSKQTPDETVKSGRWKLKAGADYKLSYQPLNIVETGTYQVTATGIGAYSGSSTCTYEITAKDISELQSSAILSQESYTYDGKAKTPSLKIPGLKEGTDYTVTYKNNTNVGTAEVVAEGKGNCTGSFTKIFTINEKVENGLPSPTLRQQEFVYNGSPQRPSLTVQDGGKTLREGTDYTVSWPAGSVNAGTYTVTVTGIGDYKGSQTASYTISKADLGSFSDSAALSQTRYRYNGSAREPSLKISGLTEGKDFTVSYSDNVEIGTATVTATGTGNYEGTIRKTFTITGEDEKVLTSISLSKRSYTYDGERHTPEATVRDEDKVLTEGTDYRLTYSSGRTEAGTYQVTAEGIGAYKGSVTESFTIRRKSLSDLNVSLSQASYTYDGTEKRPSLSIEGLKEGKDYELSYQDNIEIGTATVTATGIGNYSGSVSKTFIIKKGTAPAAEETTEEDDGNGNSSGADSQADADASDAAAGASGETADGGAKTGGLMLPIALTGIVLTAALFWFFLFWKRRKEEEEDEQAID